MSRTKKEEAGKVGPVPLLPSPMELEVRFEVRLHEAFADLYRKRRSRAYPPWARRAAAECLRWLPPTMTIVIRRAMMGRLRPAGYYHLGDIMLRHNGRTVEFLRFGPEQNGRPQIPEYETPYDLIVRCARRPDER